MNYVITRSLIVSGLALSVIVPTVIAVSPGNNRAGQTQAITEVRTLKLQQKETLRKQAQTGGIEAFKRMGTLHAERIQNRFEFYQERLQSIHAKLGEKISQAESQYGAAKVVRARQLWTQAQTKLTSAQSAGQSAVTGFQNLAGDDLTTVKNNSFTARNQAKMAITEFRAANELMHSAVKALRDVTSAKPAPSLKPVTGGENFRKAPSLPIEKPVDR